MRKIIENQGYVFPSEIAKTQEDIPKVIRIMDKILHQHSNILIKNRDQKTGEFAYLWTPSSRRSGTEFVVDTMDGCLYTNREEAVKNKRPLKDFS
jgi:hypothetical protein